MLETANPILYSWTLTPSPPGLHPAEFTGNGKKERIFSGHPSQGAVSRLVEAMVCSYESFYG